MTRKELKALAKKLHSIRQFADACVGLSNSDIYELYEREISEELKDEIDCTFWSIKEVPEPCRSALRQMGERYGIRELQEY